jgi:predicted transport protein
MMTIYALKNNELAEIHEAPFKLEREIQKIIENNLSEVMGLTLVRSEFTIKNKRIDTLAYDEQAKAFIIIEYKRDKNVSVVDQGFTYLGLMLENKADFVLEHQGQLISTLKIADVDWSQTRVVFVSPSFTDNQVQATNFKDIAIELWEIKRYTNGSVAITPIKKAKSAASIKPLTLQNTELKAISDEIKVYTEEDHRAKTSEEIYELYERFRDAILNLADDIEIKPQKFYVAFKKDGNIACLELQKKKIKIHIGAKTGQLDDPKGIAKDVSEKGHYGTGDYEVQVSNDKYLEYIMSLVKQTVHM